MTTPAHTLVIGGSKGIGRTLVRRLAEAGSIDSIVSRSRAIGC